MYIKRYRKLLMDAGTIFSVAAGAGAVLALLLRKGGGNLRNSCDEDHEMRFPYIHSTPPYFTFSLSHLSLPSILSHFIFLLSSFRVTECTS
jgi:hypothetical protein